MSETRDEARLIQNQEALDTEMIERLEQLILRVATETQADSLQALRDLVDQMDLDTMERSLVKVAIWRLLNADRLRLTADRRLQVAAG